MRFEGMPQAALSIDRVPVSPAVLGLGQIATFDEVGQDQLDCAFGYADTQCQLARSQRITPR
jgi:hypothetical protein